MNKHTEEYKLTLWASGLTVEQLKAARDEYERRVAVVSQIVSRYTKRESSVVDLVL